MPAQIPATHGTILRLDGGGPWSYHILQRDMSSSVISYTVYDGRRGQAVRSGPLAEGWHHVAATHDVKAGLIELFIDGRSVGKSACLEHHVARAAARHRRRAQRPDQSGRQSVPRAHRRGPRSKGGA